MVVILILPLSNYEFLIKISKLLPMIVRTGQLETLVNLLVNPPLNIPGNDATQVSVNGEAIFQEEPAE